jgi:PAS domain S-box-containing protein
MKAVGKEQNASITPLNAKGIIKKYKILDNLLEGVQVLDRELRYLYINNSAEKQNRRPKELFLGKKMTEVWPGISNTEAHHAITNCLKNKEVAQLEYQSLTQSGTEGWFSLSIQPVEDGILLLSLDISERKKTDQIINTSESFYHSLFDNLLNGFAYCKMLYKNKKAYDFIYLSVNKAFETLTGLKQVTGKKVSEVIPGIRRTDPTLIETYGRVASTGQTESFEIFLTSLKMWFLVTVYCPEKDYFIAIFDVITERKNAELKMQDQINELQRWYTATIDREGRYIELKKEINQLLKDAGQPPRYGDIDRE